MTLKYLTRGLAVMLPSMVLGACQPSPPPRPPATKAPSPPAAVETPSTGPSLPAVTPSPLDTLTARAGELDAAGYSAFRRSVYTIVQRHPAIPNVRQRSGGGYLEEGQAACSVAYRESARPFPEVKRDLLPRRFLPRVTPWLETDPGTREVSAERATDALEVFRKRYGDRLKAFDEVDITGELPASLDEPQEPLRPAGLPEFELTVSGLPEKRYRQAATADEAVAAVRSHFPGREVTAAPIRRPLLYYGARFNQAGAAFSEATTRAYSFAEALAEFRRQDRPGHEMRFAWEMTAGDVRSHHGEKYVAARKQLQTDWGVPFEEDRAGGPRTPLPKPRPELVDAPWIPPTADEAGGRFYRVEYAAPGKPETALFLVLNVGSIEEAVHYYWKATEPGRKGWPLCRVAFERRDPEAPVSWRAGVP